MEESRRDRALSPSLHPSCSRLENTVPAFEPHVARDLYIRSRTCTVSKLSPTKHSKASRRKAGTHHGRITHDRHRRAAERFRMDTPDDDGFHYWDECISIACILLASGDGHYLCPGTGQKSQLLCQSLLARSTYMSENPANSPSQERPRTLTERDCSRKTLRVHSRR